MTGAEALTAYGYVRDEGGRYTRPGRQTDEWEPVDGGFARFNRGVRTPFTVSAAGEGVAGIDAARPEHEAFFVWLWPDEEVARIYGHAAEQAAMGWPGEPAG